LNCWKDQQEMGSAFNGQSIRTFNEAVRDILHLRELHKQIDETG
jgi:hypothetical protein